MMTDAAVYSLDQTHVPFPLQMMSVVCFIL